MISQSTNLDDVATCQHCDIISKYLVFCWLLSRNTKQLPHSLEGRSMLSRGISSYLKLHSRKHRLKFLMQKLASKICPNDDCGQTKESHVKQYYLCYFRATGFSSCLLFYCFLIVFALPGFHHACCFDLSCWIIVSFILCFFVAGCIVNIQIHGYFTTWTCFSGGWLLILGLWDLWYR